MINQIVRIASLYSNAKMLAPYMGYGRALLWLVQSRGNNEAMTKGRYKNYDFLFRRADLPAIDEILGGKEYGFLETLLKTIPNPVIVDLGAHVGLFALWALTINPKAQIYSVEASPGTYKLLAANANSAHGDWKIVNKAAWGKNEFIRFANDHTSSMSHRIDGKGDVEVATITIEELADKKIDLMKIDIEGAEESFLTGKEAALLNVANLVIEVHPNYCNANIVTDILKNRYKNIVNINEGTTGKPLLYCR